MEDMERWASRERDKENLLCINQSNCSRQLWLLMVGIYIGTKQPRKKHNINIAEARGFEVSLSEYFDSKTNSSF